MGIGYGSALGFGMVSESEDPTGFSAGRRVVIEMSIGGVFRGIGRGVAWPFRKAKRFIIQAVALTAIRRAWQRLPERDRSDVMGFLNGSKEKITLIIASIVGVLTALGWVPDIVPLLNQISAAIAAGNWQAALSVLVGIVLALVRLFRRLRDDRESETLNDNGTAK